MKKKHVYLSDLHFEHLAWNSELKFQQDELKTFESRLAEVIPRYTDTTILAQSEQFQNQIIRHNEVLDGLLHDIKIHEQKISNYAQRNPVAIDHVYFDDHGELREKVETQRDIYADLKKGFFRYLTKYM